MTSHHNYIKKVNFASKPSAKELTFMDNLCFDSAWSEKDYLEMKKVSFFNGWLLGKPKKNYVGIYYVQYKDEDSAPFINYLSLN